MTFNPNIPQGNQALSQSAAPIQVNFSQANTLFAVDHVTFNSTDAGNRGKHYKVTYPEWVMPPQATADPVTAANEIAFYSKDVATATRGFMRQENNGTIIQMTGPDPVIAQPGTTFLPGGMLLNFGAVAATSAGVSQNFATAFPGNIFSVSLSILSNNGNDSASMTLNALTGIKIYSSVAGPITVYYMVIGN